MQRRISARFQQIPRFGLDKFQSRQSMALLLPSLFSSVSFTQGFAPPNKGEYFWEFPAADCMPDDELSSCPVNSTIAECKFLCINTPNCGCVACVCLFICIS